MEDSHHSTKVDGTGLHPAPMEPQRQPLTALNQGHVMASASAGDTGFSRSSVMSASDAHPWSSGALSMDKQSLSTLLPSQTQAKQIASDACRDIERELQAVEQRLEIYRRQRQERDLDVSAHDRTFDLSMASTAPTCGARSPSPVATGTLSTSALHQANTSSPSPATPPHKQQRAGQVADEVESALLQCEQLLRRAHRTPTPSRRRSNPSQNAGVSGSTGGSPTAMASMRFVPVTGVPLPPMSTASSHRLSKAAVNSASQDEQALESRAMELRAFAQAKLQQTENDAHALLAQEDSRQQTLLQDLERKYESKKRLTLLTLKEQSERETKAQVAALQKRQEEEQRELLDKLEDELLRKREQLLHEQVVRHEKVMEEQVKRLEARLQAETAAKKRVLQQQLAQEQSSSVEQLEKEHAAMLEEWEANERFQMDQALFQKREELAMAALTTQEAKTKALKDELHKQHQHKQAQELDKLKKALALGAQAQLQQLRRELETKHDEEVADLKDTAKVRLGTQLEELRGELKATHKRERERLERDLERKQRVHVSELHERMEREHERELDEIRERHRVQLEQLLAEEQVKADEIKQNKVMALERTLEHELSAALHDLEIRKQTELHEELGRVTQRMAEMHRLEMQAKEARLNQSTAVLLREAKELFALERTNAFAGGSDSDDSEDTLEQQRPGRQACRTLRKVQPHLGRELSKCIDVLVRDFDELVDEQHVLVTKIGEATQLYLSFKRQCARMETEASELKAALRTLHDQVQRKESMCTKLYEANQALLVRFQLAAPSVASEPASSSPQRPRRRSTASSA